MRTTTLAGRAAACMLFVACFTGTSPAYAQAKAPADKIAITTSSDEARTLYVQGRDLAEKLRATDARRLYQQAVAKDSQFALGHLGLATTSGTNKEFVEGVTRAASLAGGVSEGERHMLLGLEAQMKGDPAGVMKHYGELVRLFPNDERAHNLLANFHFGRQEYDKAIAHFVKATTINPSFSQSYNQLGYAYRFQDRFAEAEGAFKKYIQLIPNDPNPYDSYAELLMKMGRFEESIKNYEKALSLDGNFVASHVGIGNNYLSMGKFDQARTAFSRIAAVARNTGERRLARFWTAAAYVHEGATDKAVAEIKAEYALAEAERDFGSMSGDLNLMGDVLREAGRVDEALAKYQESVAAINKASVPEEVKEATRRNFVFEEGRAAVAKNDLKSAQAKAAEYAKLVAVKNVPFEVQQQHELAGLIAMADNRAPVAAKELMLANQQDARILYLTAKALQASGDAARAAPLATKAAKFNGLSFTYAFVRNKARQLAAPTSSSR